MSSQTPKKLPCPKCAGGELRRLNRIGFLERRVLCSVGIYPWECVLCRKKMYRQSDGHVDLAKREAERAAERLAAQDVAPQVSAPQVSAPQVSAPQVSTRQVSTRP